MENRFSDRLAVLREAVRYTFETLTFSETADWETLPSWPIEAANYVGSGINLLKPVRGEFSLFLDPDQCRGFVETVYGPEIWETPGHEEVGRDFLNELVNTVAGRFAATLAVEGKDIRLGLPGAIEAGSVLPGTQQPGTLLGFSLEGIRAVVRLKL